MNDIISEVKELKKLIISSKEFKKFKESELKLEMNDNVKKIIEKIKSLQKIIINKEDKGLDKEKEEIEVQSLYEKLNSYDDYVLYINSANELNDILTYIQKSFENYFNQFII